MRERRARGRATWALWGCATLFFVASLEHALGIVRPDTVLYDPPLRHVVFVAVNLACAIGFALHARGHRVALFPWFFSLLVMQQLASHGGDAWRAWTARGEVDLPSILVILFLPAALALLVATTRHTQSGDQPGPRS